MLLEVSGDFFENKSGQLLGGLKIAGLNADYLNVSLSRESFYLNRKATNGRRRAPGA